MTDNNSINAVFRIEDKLFFQGFEELGDKVVLIDVDGAPILRSAKEGEVPTFTIEDHVCKSPSVLDYFVKYRALECEFSNFDGAYHKRDAKVAMPKIDLLSSD